MAGGNRIEFTIGLNVDKTQMSRLEADIERVIGKMNSGMTKNKGNNALVSQMKETKNTAAQLGKILEQTYNPKTGTINIQKFNTALQSSGLSVRKLNQDLAVSKASGAATFARLGSSILGMNTKVKEGNKVLSEMSKTLANSFRYSFSYGIINKFTQGVQEAFNYVKKLDTSLNNIQIVTGQSAEQMAQFAQKANEAAKAMGTATTSYTDAALIYYQQGLDDAAAQERTDVTVKLSNVMQTSAKEVSQYMTSIWNNFDDGSESLEHYADVITNLGAHTASSSAEIAQGLEKFAAVAETAGLSYEYATTALSTVVATTRQSADTVGTAFKTLFARIQDLEQGDTLDDGTTLGKYAEALDKVGVNIKDQMGGLKDMDSILNEIGDKWDKISKDQQLALAENVAGVRQYTQFVALMDNWDFFKENLEYAQNANGTLEKQQETYMESISAKLQTLKATKEELFSDIINEDVEKGGITQLTNVVDVFDKFVKSFGGGMKAIAAFGVVVSHVFNKQIGGAIQSGIKNILQYQQNVTKIKMKLQTAQEIKNKKGGTPQDKAAIGRYKIELEYAEKILLLRNKITQEEFERLTTLQKELGQAKEEELLLKSQLHALKINEKELKDYINLMRKSEDVGATLTEKMPNKTNTQIKEIINQIKQLINAMDKAKGSAITLEEELSVLNIGTGISRAFSAASSAATTAIMSFSSLSMMMRTLQDDSLSLGEKFSQAFMTLGFTVPMLVSSMHGLSTALREQKAVYAGLSAEQILNNSLKEAGVEKTVELTIAEGTEEAVKKKSIRTARALALARILGVETLVLEKVKTNELTMAQVIATAVTNKLKIAIMSTAGIIALVAAGVAVLVYAIVQYRNAVDKAYNEASEYSKNMSDTASELKDKYEELKKTIEDYSDAKNAIQDLTQGTLAWKEAVVDLNNQVLTLLNTYPELARYISNNDGLLEISDAGLDAILEKQLKISNNAQAAAITAQKSFNDQQNRKTAQDTRRALNKEAREDGGINFLFKGMSGWKNDNLGEKNKFGASEVAFNALLKEYQRTNQIFTKDTLKTTLDLNDFEASFITDDIIDSINNAIASIDANTETNEMLTSQQVEAALSNNDEYQRLVKLRDGTTSNEQKKYYQDQMDDITNIVENGFDSMIEENRESISAFNEELREMYAEEVLGLASGSYTTKTKFNGDVVIKDTENDKEYKLNEEQFSQTIAELQATQDITRDITTYVNQLDEIKSLVAQIANKDGANIDEQNEHIAQALTTFSNGKTGNFDNLTEDEYNEIYNKVVTNFNNDYDYVSNLAEKLGFKSAEDLKKAFEDAALDFSKSAIDGIEGINVKSLSAERRNTLAKLYGGRSVGGDATSFIDYGQDDVFNTWLGGLGDKLDEAIDIITQTGDFSTLSNTEIIKKFREAGIEVSDKVINALQQTTNAALDTYTEIINRGLNEALDKQIVKNAASRITDKNSKIYQIVNKKDNYEELLSNMQDLSNQHGAYRKGNFNGSDENGNYRYDVEDLSSDNEATKAAQDFAKQKAEYLQELAKTGYFTADSELAKSIEAALKAGFDTASKEAEKIDEAFDELVDGLEYDAEEELKRVQQEAYQAVAESASTVSQLETFLTQGLIDEETKNNYTKQAATTEATSLGIDAGAFEQYAQHLIGLSGIDVEKDKEAVGLMYEYALECEKATLGQEKLNTAVDDYGDILKSKSGKYSTKYAEGVSVLRESIQQLVGGNEVGHLTDEFLTSSDVMELYEKIIEGDSKALTELGKLCGKKYLVSIGIEEGSDKFNEITSKLDEIASKYKNLENLTPGDIDSLNKTFENLNLTKEQIEELGKSWDINFEFEEDPINNATNAMNDLAVGADNANNAVSGAAGGYLEFENVAEDGATFEVDTVVKDDIEMKRISITPKPWTTKYPIVVPNVGDDGSVTYEQKGTTDIKVASDAMEFYVPANAGSATDTTVGNHATTNTGTPLVKSAQKQNAGKALTPSSSKSKSSSGGGGSSDKEKEDKKFESEFDKYVQQQQVIDRATHSITKMDKAKEHLAGNSLAKTLEAENKLLEQQNKAYKSMRKARLKDAKDQNAELQYYGFKFDKVGNFTNYDKIVKQLENEEKAAIEKYNKNKSEANENAADKLTERNKYVKELIDSYKENQSEINSLNEQLLDNWYQEIEQAFEAYEANIVIQLELSEAKVQWNDFLKDLNKDFTLKFQDRSSSIDTSMKNYDIYKNDAETIYNEMMDVWGERELASKGKSKLFATAADAESKFRELSEKWQDNVEKMASAAESAYNDMVDTINDFGEQLKGVGEKLEDLDTSLDTQADMVSLMYGDKAYDMLGKIYQAQVDTKMAQTRNYQEQYKYWENIYNQSKEDSELRSTAEDNMREIQKSIETNTKDTVEEVKKVYETMVNAALEGFTASYFGAVGQLDNGIYDYGNGIYGTDMLKEQWENAKTQTDKYYDSVEKTYQLTSLEKKYKDAIDSTDSINQQQQLNALMEEQLKMLSEKENLSESDMEFAEKRLEIAKAQMALDDANNNKTTMQLVRDAAGNYTYKYTADQDDVREKTQALRDSIEELYELQKQAARDAADVAIEIEEKFVEALRGVEMLGLEGEAKSQAIEQIKQQYLGTNGLITTALQDSQYYNAQIREGMAASAYQAQKDSLESSVKISDEMAEIYKALTDAGIEDFSNLFISVNEGLVNVDKETDKALSQNNGGMQYLWNTAMANISKKANNKYNEVKTYAKTAITAIEDAQTHMENQTNEVLAQVGTSYEEYGKTVGNVTEEIKSIEKEQDTLVKKINDTIPGLCETVNTFVDAWGDAKSGIESTATQVSNLTGKMNTLNQSIKDFSTNIKAAKADSSDFSYTPKTSSDSNNSNNGTNKKASNEDPSKDTKKKFQITLQDDKKDNLVVASFTATEDGWLSALSRISSDSFTNKNVSSMPKYLNIFKDGVKQTEKDANASKYLDYGADGMGHAVLKGLRLNALKKLLTPFDTGGYTGEWGNSGKAAILHQKELVLNQSDTSKILDAVELVRSIGDVSQTFISGLTNGISSAIKNLARVEGGNGGQTIEQKVEINADFPNATNANEIEKALNNLTNVAIQHANR